MSYENGGFEPQLSIHESNQDPRVLFMKTGLWPGGGTYADLRLLTAFERENVPVSIVTGNLHDMIRQDNEQSRRFSIEENASLDKKNTELGSGDQRVQRIMDTIGEIAHRNGCNILLVSSPFFTFGEYNEAVVQLSKSTGTILRIHDPVDDVASLQAVDPRAKVAATTAINAELISGLHPSLDVVVLPPFLNFSDYVPQEGAREKVRNKYGIRNEDVLVLQPTRVSSQKGIGRALYLAAEMNRQIGNKRNVFLLVTGGNEPVATAVQEQQKLLELARQYKFDNLIFLNGVPSHGGEFQLADYYKSANLITFLSQVEGFGLPPAESAIVGVPCVSSRFIGSRGHQVFDEVYDGFDFIIEQDLHSDRVSPVTIERAVDVINHPNDQEESRLHNKQSVERYNLNKAGPVIQELLEKFKK